MHTDSLLVKLHSSLCFFLKTYRIHSHHCDLRKNCECSQQIKNIYFTLQTEFGMNRKPNLLSMGLEAGFYGTGAIV